MNENVSKLLLVDDNIDFINSVQTILKNFQVIPATSPSEAERKLNNEIDIILLDLVFDDNRPENLQGLIFLEKVKQKFPELPTIIITNYSETDITVKAIKSGADVILN